MISRAKLKRELIRQKDGYLFIMPQMALFLAFMVYPVFEGVKLSFYKVTFINQTFVGLKNYIDLFSDPIFIKAILNNLQFVFIVTALCVVSGLFISTAVFDKTEKYMSFIRGCYYLPVMVTMVAFSITWLWILNPAMGFLNYLLNCLGHESVNFMGNPKIALYVLIAVMWMFNVGEVVILYLAAILGIPQDLFEAAEIDGASRFKVIRHIIIPLVSPTTIYFMILCFIDIIKVFLAVHLMTAGGPNYATTTMMYMCYQEAFVNNNMGKASAIGMIMFVIVSLLSLATIKQFKVFKIKQ